MPTFIHIDMTLLRRHETGYVEAYLRQILGFIGIEDVQTVRAEGMNIPPLAIHAVPNGEEAVDALAV